MFSKCLVQPGFSRSGKNEYTYKKYYILINIYMYINSNVYLCHFFFAFSFLINLSLLCFLSCTILCISIDFKTTVLSSLFLSPHFLILSSKICLFLKLPQIFNVSLKSKSSSSGPCIATIISPCRTWLVSLFLSVVFILPRALNPLSHSEDIKI